MQLLMIIVAFQQLLDIASTWYALRTGHWPRGKHLAR